MATSHRTPAPASSSSLSQTQTQAPRSSQTQTLPQTQTQTHTQAVLRLRGADRTTEEVQSKRRIQWAEDVVDNEGLGRKSSKVCCIYHAPRQNIDDSSDESSSDSSGSDTDSGDDGAARPSNSGRKVGGHDHDHKKGKARARSPNAYEKVPKVKPKGGETKD